jgi:hypothetical protein
MRIEDELRGALDVPAPPPATRLEDVLARGRRKIAVRRAGIAGSTLAVVAVVVLGLFTWPFESRSASDPMNWARAAPAPRQVADPPRNSRACKENPTPTPNLDVGGETLAAGQVRAWRDLTQAALPDERISSEHPEVVENELSRVFTVYAGDTGSVRFSRSRFDGSPVAAADKSMWGTGACNPPRRTTTAEGTVFQLYDGIPAGQSMYVFRADGRRLRIDQINVAGSLGTLPLTDAEFVRLGAAVAEVL